MNRNEFLNIENWYGSYYELAIEYHPKGNNKTLIDAINAIWQLTELTGPWREKEMFGEKPQKIELVDQGTNDLFGLVTFKGVRPIGCCNFTIRESFADGADWLCFSVPTSMLELAFDVKYPLFDDENPWLKSIDRFFLKCAKTINDVSPFYLAIIGEDASGYTTSNEITPEIASRGGFILSEHILNSWDTKVNFETLSENLLWIPFKA